MTHRNQSQRQVQPSGATPELRCLDALVGEWTVEIAFAADPAKIVHEQTSCVWLEGGAFLLMRSAADDPRVPNSSAVIGRDETADTYAML